MGVPKRLTEMQKKFAHELVSNEGRKYAYQCAIDAGYAQDRSRQTSYELQSPKYHPLVVKYIGEIRQEYQKKYAVTFERHISELGKIRQEGDILDFVIHMMFVLNDLVHTQHQYHIGKHTFCLHCSQVHEQISFAFLLIS